MIKYGNKVCYVYFAVNVASAGAMYDIYSVRAVGVHL